MKIQGFNTTSNDENSAPEQDFFEQVTSKKKEQAKKIISAKYTPAGPQYGREFRTTLKLQYEFQEMISLSESAVNDAMTELGFEVAFIDGKPNYVLYPIRTETED
jgi:hypothetical protein